MTLRYCDRHGCPIRANGMLRMNIPPIGYEKDDVEPLQLPVPLCLCDFHAKEAKALDFQTTEWCGDVRRVLKNRGSDLSPDFENAWLDVVPFGQMPMFGEHAGVHR